MMRRSSVLVFGLSLGAGLAGSLAGCSGTANRPVLRIDVTSDQAFSDVALWLVATGTPASSGGAAPTIDRTFNGATFGPGTPYKAGMFLTVNLPGPVTISAEASAVQCVRGRGSVVVPAISTAPTSAPIQVVVAPVAGCEAPRGDGGLDGDGPALDATDARGLTGTGGNGSGGGGAGTGSGGIGSGGDGGGTGGNGTGGAGTGTGGNGNGGMGPGGSGTGASAPGGSGSGGSGSGGRGSGGAGGGGGRASSGGRSGGGAGGGAAGRGGTSVGGSGGGGAAGAGGMTACPIPVSSMAIHYVDPLEGTDDPAHGGAYGACGYKTLTYALAHATYQIALQTAIYTASTEVFPIVLTGQQRLLCNVANTGPATIRGMGVYQPNGHNLSIVIAGTENGIVDCIVDGTKVTPGSCIDVTTDATPALPHVIQDVTVGDCTGTAILVELDKKYLTISNSTVHDALNGVLWISTTGTENVGSMTKNTFTGDGIGVGCNGPDLMVTGSGNKYSVPTGGNPCALCGNCPF